jgi:dTDP-4-amino-4,6-dideoxygalactose transaminase
MNGRVPILDLKAQFATIRTSVEAAIARVVESQVFILGPEVDALERDVAHYCEAKFAVGVASGTDAILVSLMALGVGPGDEVITSPYTFIATAACLARIGATATFIDIEPSTFNLDASQLERKLTKRTKAIVPIHLFGQMADMRMIVDLSTKYGIPVVEDAAQAIGAERYGQRAGSVGTFGCLSFFPSKNLGAFGDAGMVLCNDDDLASRLRRLRNQGQDRKYFAAEIGGNFRMDAIHAAVLRAKLPHLEAWTDARRRNAAIYRRLFADAGFDGEAASVSGEAPVVLPRELLGVRHTYNQFVIRALDRDALRMFLAERGIASEVYYPLPMHLQACFVDWKYCAGDFPEAERAAQEALAIPIYPELTESMQERVVATISAFYRARKTAP